jgi:hypothetical protein
VSSSPDDHIRSVLDRLRVTLSGQLEDGIQTSAADILRVVAEGQRNTQQLSSMRAEFAREREDLQRGAAFEIGGLERTVAETRDELDRARQHLQQARDAQEALGLQLEQRTRDQERNASEMEALRARLADTVRLTAAIRTLDEATSLREILERLIDSASQVASRTAVFLVNGGRLRGWRALGFDAAPIAGAAFEPAEAGVIEQAARSGLSQRHRAGDATLLPLFAAADGPRDAVAEPVQVGGSVIAVLYADAARADRPEDPEWLKTIDLMAQHAGRVLEAMTVRQAAALWTPRAVARR